MSKAIRLKVSEYKKVIEDLRKFLPQTCRDLVARLVWHIAWCEEYIERLERENREMRNLDLFKSNELPKTSVVNQDPERTPRVQTSRGEMLYYLIQRNRLDLWLKYHPEQTPISAKLEANQWAKENGQPEVQS